MWERAVAEGMELILFSEHARATSVDWFGDFAAEVRQLPQTPCRALVGAEVKVADFDGRLDIAAQIRDACDLVMASVHRFPGEKGVVSGTTGGYSPEQAVDIEFSLSMAALDNPDADILGHPFGMSYRRFGTEPPWPLIERLIEKCAAQGKAFEINAQYHPEPRRLLRACLDAGAYPSFGSNAHAEQDVGALARHAGWRDAS